ncbi:CBS domain-containing protein [Candidatus Thorarchaeota archaeon]|nr:MAG: CBS domain-containing protein [Candidatus Thorarchaeota archaeon]
MKIRDCYKEGICAIDSDEKISKVLDRLKNSDPPAMLVTKAKGDYEGVLSRRWLIGSGFDPNAKVQKYSVSAPKLQETDAMTEAARLMIESQVPLLPVFAGTKLKGTITINDIISEASKQALSDTVVEAVMTDNPITIHTDDSISRILDLFRTYGISHAPVTEKGKLEGIVSIDDIIDVVYRTRERQEGGFGGQKGHGGHGERTGRKSDLREMKARAVMSTPVIDSRPSDSLEDAEKKMREQDVTSLVIIDDEMVVGILTKRDLLQPIARDAMEEKRMSVQFSAKPGIRMNDEEMEAMRRTFDSFARRYKDVVGIGGLFVYLRRYGAVSKGDQLIQCRMQFRTAHTQYYSSAEAWSVEEAYSLALERLERQIISHKDTKLDSEHRRKHLENQLDSLRIG